MLKKRHIRFGELVQKELAGWTRDQGEADPYGCAAAHEALQTLCEAYYTEFELYKKHGVEWSEWLHICGFEPE